ncbi:hypothetical protein [Picosynechococcus sp. NKBG15041c]|uniref:hypothetical protein n=1 Tax=Picosynechococcus sp. NKBG15041c TaxID=1407650 RepID=UPI0004630C95|nr:hypothetical protein [Picosynechococcus sp. NKBG15041c]
MLLETSPRFKFPLSDSSNTQESEIDEVGLINSPLTSSRTSWRVSRIVRINKTAEYSDFQKSIQGLKNLDEIDEDEIDDEDDVITPSTYALTEAWKLLNEIRLLFKDAFPYCSSSLETKGGIDLVWDNHFLERRVWVEIPNNEQANGAVFYREKDQSKFINKVDFKRVMRLLLWLNDSQMSIEDI